jgi:hypothetical protein
MIATFSDPRNNEDDALSPTMGTAGAMSTAITEQMQQQCSICSIQVTTCCAFVVMKVKR